MRTLPLLAVMLTAHPALAAADPVEAARGVVTRMLPKHADRFVFTVLPADQGRDLFELEARDGKVHLRGPNGLSMCSGLNWYLKYYCRASVSWCGDQLNLPEPLPETERVIRRVCQERYRYFFNYCTFSYSLAWWDWPQWERMIDWLALNGVNLPLAITGQEATWQATGRRLGLSDAQMAEFFVGPAYLPFGWMGCIDGWGGPLPQGWIDRHRELQKKILARQRELGMTPVLQGFTGHVPAALRDRFPDIRFQRPSPWCGFESTHFIDPADPLFEKVGRIFMEEQAREFGGDHYYAADTFIEMTPPSGEPAFLASMAGTLYRTMQQTDPEARWVMQGWIFVNNPQFWQPPQARAFFGAVPDERMILLDMSAGESWQKTEAFYGKNWLWTIVHDFGGLVTLHGDLPGFLERLEVIRNSESRGRYAGLGMIMESLGYNPLVNDLIMEMPWRSEIPSLETWVQDYARRRYGQRCERAERAWKLLLDSVYRSPVAVTSPLCSRPGLAGPSNWINLGLTYDPAILVDAGRHLLGCADQLGPLDTYQFDLVNVTRQVLSNHSLALHKELIDACLAGDRPRIQAAGRAFLDLGRDLDSLLATRGEFLLGRWLADARRWGDTEQERRHYEWNARLLITLWGPKDSMLNGYAHKQWSGMFRGFYVPRWELFLRRLEEALEAGRDFDQAAFEREIRDWEESWTQQTEEYPLTPVGDPVATAARLWNRWLPEPPAE